MIDPALTTPKLHEDKKRNDPSARNSRTEDKTHVGLSEKSNAIDWRQNIE
jgi:hypothetical protein